MVPKILIDSGRKPFMTFWSYWDGLPKVDHLPLLKDYFDHAPPELQPGMLILDVTSPTTISVRLAGTAVVQAVGELTGLNEDKLYADDVRLQMIGRTWTAATHPCGYMHTRFYRNVDGYKMVSPGVGLPIRSSNPDVKTVMVFNDDAAIGDPIGLADGDAVVQTHGKVTWLDIGAGVPEDS
jgi:hypothetical protein